VRVASYRSGEETSWGVVVGDHVSDSRQRIDIYRKLAQATDKLVRMIVGFPAGCPSCTSPNRSIQSLAAIDTYFTNLAAYYTEVSYGKITLRFSFFGPSVSTVSAVAAGVITHPHFAAGDDHAVALVDDAGAARRTVAEGKLAAALGDRKSRAQISLT